MRKRQKIGEMQGFCAECSVLFRWVGAPFQADARCPKCGGELTRKPRKPGIRFSVEAVLAMEMAS